MIDLLILILLVTGIVLVTARWKVSPFLALLGAALLGTFLYRLPVAESITTVTQAFGNTLGNIGLVIIFGTMIGVILERSGAAISMAGRRRVPGGAGSRRDHALIQEHFTGYSPVLSEIT